MPETKQEGVVAEEVATKREVAPEVAPEKRKPVRKFFKFFVDFKKWSSYDEVSSNAKTAWGLFRRLTRRNTEIRNESYEDAISRLNLTPEEVVKRKNTFLYSALVYAFFAIGFFIYFVYLLINIRLLAASLTLLLVVLMSLATYREHFWYMQMKQKRLGCNFQDWLAFVLRRPIK